MVSGIPRIPENERDCYLGYPDSNPKPPVPKHPINHQLNLGNPEKKQVSPTWCCYESDGSFCTITFLGWRYQASSKKHLNEILKNLLVDEIGVPSRFHQETKNCQQKHLNILQFYPSNWASISILEDNPFNFRPKGPKNHWCENGIVIVTIVSKLGPF